MRWQKHGLIFAPDRSRPWMRSHASLPVALPGEGSLCRVYFASRDAGQRSHVGWFDIDLDRPERILAVAGDPVLAPGPLGFFDCHGIYAASAVRHEGRIYLYTIGWNRGDPAPLFYAGIGLAVSEDGGATFRKHGRAPIMARSEHDPSLVTSPMVLREGGRWRMWYVSGDAWEAEGATLRSHYNIKYAESADGVEWRRDGLVCIDHEDAQERNIGRACVLRDGGLYRAWFATSRGQGYRIGQAVSPDGLAWRREEAAEGLEPSASGWDAEAIAYPWVIRHRDRWLMFHNGNGFGRDGIGLASAEAA